MTVMDDLADRKSGIAAPAPIGNDRQRTLRAGFIPLVDASVLIAACSIAKSDIWETTKANFGFSGCCSRCCSCAPTCRGSRSC